MESTTGNVYVHKMHVEINETTPAISFDRFYEVFACSKKRTLIMIKKHTCGIRNRRIRKESKTDVESATFEK